MQQASNKMICRGRPTKLEKRIAVQIAAGIRSGLAIEVACELAGVDDSTYYRWLQRGSEGEAEFCDFCDIIKRAQAEAEVNLLKIIQTASEDHWQAAAWILERRFPGRWARKNAVALEVHPKPQAGTRQQNEWESLSTEVQIKQLRELADLLEDPEIAADVK